MTRVSRLVRGVLVLGLVVCFVSSAAFAGRFGEKKKRVTPERDSEGAPVVQLQSELVAQIPDVAEALEAVRARPGDAALWQALAAVLTEAGDRPDAAYALESALQLEPDDDGLWVDYGAVLIQIGDINDGIDALEKALKIEPFQALAHYNLGIAYQEKGRYDDALASLERALLLAPELADPKVNPGAINNPDLPMAQLRMYLKTVGAAPALTTGDIRSTE